MRRFSFFVLLLAACGSDKPRALDDPSAPPPHAADDQRQGGTTSLGSQGQTLPASLAWQGFAEGSDTATTVRLADLADPDGSRGIRGILVETVTPLCSICIDERPTLDGLANGKWRDLGIHVVQLVLEDDQGTPATVETAHAWKVASGASWSVVADPGFTFSHTGTNPLPVRLAVDPRTMTVVTRTEGKDTTWAGVEALAAANGAP